MERDERYEALVVALLAAVSGVPADACAREDPDDSARLVLAVRFDGCDEELRFPLPLDVVDDALLPWDGFSERPEASNGLDHVLQVLENT